MDPVGLLTGAPEMSMFLLGFVIWEMVWKGFALWRAGRRNEPAWFFIMFILNTLGILPIVYLIITNNKKESPKPVEKKSVKKKVVSKKKK